MQVGEKVGDDKGIMMNCVFQPFPIGAVSNLVHVHSKITHKRLSLFRWFTLYKLKVFRIRSFLLLDWLCPIWS